MINALDLDYKMLKRTRKVNGNRVIELDVFPTDGNKQYFDLLVEEAIITFKGDEYVIKKVTEKSIGNTYFKQVTAIHKFYVDLINKQQYDVHNGSITFQNYMNFVFEDTPYENFEVIDSFNAREFENLGDDNRLALLQKGLDRFKAELELVGSNYKPRFRKMIGRDTDFQFRFGHNIKAISRDIDTTNLATHIRGYGDEELGIYAEYTSPNAAIFGKIDAPTVRDERFKSNSAMLDEIKSRLIDEPEISITVDFIDLRKAGYPYTIPNEGDRIWLIYEPMDDLLIETRIMEIVEYFDANLNVIKTEVTLSNHKKSFADTVFENTQKQLREIVNNDGVIRYSALDEAVKIATEALQSAQTELIFENGIIARDKNDPNKIVIFNSAGIGISHDGGQTFETAITGDGMVANVITSGLLNTSNIVIGDDDGRVTIDKDGVSIKDGSINIERPDGTFWMEDGLVHQDYAVTGADPHRMDESVGPGGRSPAFYQQPGAGAYYSAYTEDIDGDGPYAEDIRDPNKGYTVNFQRYYFIHSARYFVVRFQPSTRMNGLDQVRTRLYEDNEQLYSRDFTRSEYGTFYRLIADLGTPTYDEVKLDLRIGYLRQWRRTGGDVMVFRISRAYLTDYP